MRISVITPVYNAELFLYRCVDSILAQTFTDFELILVDDGSPDQCGAICDEYAKKDSRIRVIHQANSGQAAARNRALDIATGTYIAFVDSDDYVHPQYLETLWNNLQMHHATISICGHTKVSGTIPPAPLQDSPVRSWDGKTYVRKCLMGDITNKVWLLWDKLFHRSCFDHLRLPEGRINEDNAVVYKMLYEAEKIAECDEPLYFYFYNEESTVNQRFQRKHLDWLLVLEEMIWFFTQHKDSLLVDKSNRSYLYALEDLYHKSHMHLQDPQIENELKCKLKHQYELERKKYPITIRSHPGLYEILFPRYSWCYWTVKAILNKLSKR